ncbi:Rmf/CrpP fold protein [Streptomyces sp. VNUA116]|uniref:Rmf/CrpP fold protein n=1 Tax=Streptomyces sp. VNUA116 TaxID=3062449 RepID=UPI0026764B5F|nr:Rmf/CrpP fold protein [Streptomyces sp. VNUA116]WKU45977.1 Rmf/CrpP fold protein [Streptomyces sp. VNUA116]
MGFREAAVRAYQDGQAAAHAGRPATDCPHPADSLLRLAWVRGYLASGSTPTAEG